MDETIEEKLKYIGLDLDKIPIFLKEFTPLDFRPSKTREDNKHMVYKYVPIDKIQILITPKNRLDDIEQKYTKAAPIIAYLEPNDEENLERHTKFLAMLKQVSIEKIEQAIDDQKKINKKIPFDVKYHKSYEWQIYYSEFSKQYFMMMPSEDFDYEKMFLLLKMQIEYNKNKTKKVPQIFIPINYIDYSEEYLRKSEIKDIENYLWLFTKDWANIYEVYDKNNQLTLEIIGQTIVYENIKSKYKVVLSTKEEAVNFYQYIKALFVLQTELSMHYKFKTKINSRSGLEFFYNDTKIKHDGLSKFIENEYSSLQKKDIKNDEQIIEQKSKLTELKNIAKDKENEYLDKQRQIALYLECKKTFFGKVKYFFKIKRNSVTIFDETKNNNDCKSLESTSDNEQIIVETKNYYTIEDLVTLHYTADKKIKELTNINMDIEALKNKIENIELKVRNATLYINEIDKHKKSIFEFWKFANKDEQKTLEIGTTLETTKKHINKTFKYEFDFEDLSVKMDKLQRVKLSKIEQDSVFVATTDMINIINDINLTEEYLTKLKQEQEKNIKVYNFQEFNIFGNIQDNRTNTRNLGNQKHRENPKDLLKILSITQNTTVEECTNKIEEIKNNLNESFKKIKSKYNMAIYVVSETPEILNKDYTKYYINLEEALKNSDLESKEINVYKINIQENMPILYCTNIIFYDNFNKTLPEGMNVEQTAILNNVKYQFALAHKEEFKTNMYFENEENVQVKKVIINEYDINLKE